jgi:hypothetical protein
MIAKILAAANPMPLRAYNQTQQQKSKQEEGTTQGVRNDRRLKPMRSAAVTIIIDRAAPSRSVPAGSCNDNRQAGVPRAAFRQAIGNLPQLVVVDVDVDVVNISHDIVASGAGGARLCALGCDCLSTERTELP